MSEDKALRPAGGAVARFLEQAARVPAPVVTRGRLVFALDATASRQPTWNQACELQHQMFDTAAALGGLAIQVCYYRGTNEFRVLPWATHADALHGWMREVRCAAGETQIERVLEHAAAEARASPLGALVFVGDCLEEQADRVLAAAGRLALRGVRAFMFQEGEDPRVRQTFQAVARLTRGAYAAFDARSPATLRALLEAAAVYATGGAEALRRLESRPGGAVAALTRQLEGG